MKTCDCLFAKLAVIVVLALCAATIAYFKLASWCGHQLSPAWFAAWLASSYTPIAIATLLAQRALPWTIRPGVITAIILSILWPTIGLLLLAWLVLQIVDESKHGMQETYEKAKRIAQATLQWP